MKFGELKPDDPWFVTAETRALVGWLEDQRSGALQAVVGKIRDNNSHVAAEYVGQWDAFGKVLTMIREGKET